MRHTSRLWFCLVVLLLLTVGGNHQAVVATPANENVSEPDGEAGTTPDSVGEESMSMPALLREGSELEQQIYMLLRSLKFPHTIGTAAVPRSSKRAKAQAGKELVPLREQVRQWKQKASDFLFSSDDSMLRVNSVLPVLYFSLATKILQARMLTGKDKVSDELRSMHVPVAMAWAAGKAFQDMLTEQLRLEWQDDMARVSLREEFIADIRVGMAALNPSDASHLQATKHILLRTLYAQLLRNEYYSGKSTELPVKLRKDMPVRINVLFERRGSYAQAQLVAAIHAVAPRLNIPASGLEKPLHADKNWELVTQLRKDFPHLQTFTNTALATRLYLLIPEEQRKRIAVNSSTDFERFLTLGELLLFPNLLSSAVKQLDFVLDGDQDSNAALARVIRDAKLSAAISVLRQLQIQNSDAVKAINSALLKRRDELKIDGAAWYQAAVLFLPTLKERVRSGLVSDLIAIAKRINTIEELALKPVALSVLNKSLWRTFHVDDFSGDFQRAIAEVTQSKDYAGARKVYFQKLATFLHRLQGKQISVVLLAKMSVDDIQAKYVVSNLSDAIDSEVPAAADAVSDKSDLHHISQVKAFLRYGEWFGFFKPLITDAPRIDDLPLTDAQKENYFLELKYALIDRFPLLLIKHDKKHLHELLIAEDLEQDAQWPLIESVLAQQQDMILKTIRKVEQAESASDFKHLLAHSYAINSAMQEYAGLYPTHRKKAEQFGKPSKFWKDLEALDHKYVGAFFMVLISLHLGDWLMAKHPSTIKLLRYTSALQKPNQYVVGILASVLFAGIILEWVAVETFKVFVLAPHKLNRLYDYYELGNSNDKFLSRTLLDYIELEQKAEKLNYGFEGAMHGAFVGWFGYQAFIKRMLKPQVAEKTKKLLQRVGIAETREELARAFDASMLRSRAEEQIALFKNKVSDGVISELYGREQIRQVILARRKLEKKIVKITRDIEKTRIQLGGSISEDELLMTLFRRQIYRTQEELEHVPVDELLQNYDEAITLALSRIGRSSAASSASLEVQEALIAFGLPANFFEATKPENMEALVIRNYKAKVDSYRVLRIEERDRLKGILSDHKAVLDEEIKRFIQSMSR